jgi:subtilisin family serine protease
VIAQIQTVLNAIFIEINPSVLYPFELDPRVNRISRIVDYEGALSITVPRIGAKFLQQNGYAGTGIKVAVLDSGIDYLHAAFGGSGDVTEFEENDPGVIEPGTFPTEKVVGGYDFVGDTWPLGALSSDPDPLDKGSGAGHGTHVAHIIAGVGGVAPGADLYAVKVCSSVGTSCSGIAMLQGIDFAVDPNGDGNLDNKRVIILTHLDNKRVINMRLETS